MKRLFVDRWGDLYVGWFITFIFAAIAVAILSVTCGVNALWRHYDAQKCGRLEQVLGQDTEFVSYNWWSWDCLTVVDGQLVNADDYVQMTQIRLMGGES